jgi:hypothetical protein
MSCWLVIHDPASCVGESLKPCLQMILSRNLIKLIVEGNRVTGKTRSCEYLLQMRDLASDLVL